MGGGGGFIYGFSRNSDVFRIELRSERGGMKNRARKLSLSGGSKEIERTLTSVFVLKEESPSIHV